MKPYNQLNSFWKKKYGKRVQRIPVSTGLGCPNRTKKNGINGCIFCDPTGSGFAAESPTVPIEEQIKTMIQRTEKKYGEDIYFAVYLQSYTNTYAPVEKLKHIFDALFIDERIKVLDISTRPDCVEQEKLDLIATYKDKADILIEYGLQSVNRDTLIDLNRGHTLVDFIDAVFRTKKIGIDTLAHMIVDLPQDAMEDVVEGAQILSALGVDGVKLHSLYVVEGTELDRRIKQGRYDSLPFDEFVEREIRFLEYLDPSIVIHRLCSEPPKENAHGNWGMLKIEIIQEIERSMHERNTYQGKRFTYLNR